MTDDPKTPFHTPFGDLRRLTGVAPAAPSPSPAAAPSTAPADPKPPPGAKAVARAVVRLERAGRGGKDVTVVEQLALTSGERERWLKALKAALGCGGSVEGEALVLQGDHRARLPGLLASRGVKKVIVG